MATIHRIHLILAAVLVSWTVAFTVVAPPLRSHSINRVATAPTILFAKRTPLEGSNETAVVTKEMFLRDLLRDDMDDDEDDSSDVQPIQSETVTVKRKGKKGKGGQNKPYRVLDNRDTLPFAVQVATPDPYTHPQVKQQKGRKNSVAPKKKPNAVEESSIASSLYLAAPGNSKKKKKKDDSSSMNNLETWIGDFALDKLTTTGDILEIGDRQYKVVQHKCQYKYAGGQRFVMTKKVLQVKEVGRLRTEEYLQKQLDASGDDSPSDLVDGSNM